MQGREVTFSVDPINEMVVIAAALAAGERAESFRKVAVRHPPDAFLATGHPPIWRAIREAHNRGLAPDPATLARLSCGEIDVAYLAELMHARPEVPDDATLKFSLDQLAWDRQKYVAVTGPIEALIEAISKSGDPERVRGLARAVSAAFDGWGDRKHLLDPNELVRAQIADMRERMVGRAIYPYGREAHLSGLDSYEENGEQKWRTQPGAKPGLVTVITGVPGAGKSSFVARIVLAQIRMRRKVLYGAWEMTGGVTLELLAVMSLGWSRSDMSVGRFRGGQFTNVQLRELETRMNLIAEHVTFMANPFRRTTGGGRASNERNLDIVHGYLADSGCSVFVADLWKRCLVETRPDDEEEALYRQQAMLEELGVHGILVQQQRSKDVEQRPDKRPTREGIKGSGAWTEVPDTILGVHRPALWKPVTDNVLEVIFLKQRYGKWPIAVEFDWDAELGMISGGRKIDYEMMGGGGSNNDLDASLRTKSDAGKKGRGWR
jgi:hypothetical protein